MNSACLNCALSIKNIRHMILSTAAEILGCIFRVDFHIVIGYIRGHK